MSETIQDSHVRNPEVLQAVGKLCSDLDTRVVQRHLERVGDAYLNRFDTETILAVIAAVGGLVSGYVASREPDEEEREEAAEETKPVGA